MVRPAPPEPPLSLPRTLEALAEPTRFAVVEHLRRGPARAGELAEIAGCSAPALTRHLRVLREAGVVEESTLPSDGRVRVYTLVPEPFAALSDWARDATTFWTGQLDAFAAHVQSTRG